MSWTPFVRHMATKVLLAALGMASLALAGCTTEDAGTPSTADSVLAQLRATYVDQPYRGGQATPEHTWLRVSTDSILFLHWNHADPAQATGLLFVGDGFRARGCVGEGGVSQQQIDAGFVHFHKESSANWDQGHHTSADPTLIGWWLRHVGATDSPMAMMPGMPDIHQGEVYPLMPSHENAPECPPSGLL
jgi:hypothetical protein